MNMKKILVSALSCCMILSSCGTVDKSDTTGVTPDIIAAQEANQEVSTDDIMTAEITDPTEEETQSVTKTAKTSAVSESTGTGTSTTYTTVSGVSKKRSGANSQTTTSANNSSDSNDSSGNRPVTTQANVVDGASSNNVAVAELPVYAPPTDGRVVENPNIVAKQTTTTETSSEENTETTTTAVTNDTDTPETTTTDLRVTENLTPQELLNNMTLQQKVCQLFVVKPESLTGISAMTEVGEGTKNALYNYPVGGIIYFADNLVSQSQIIQMISDTQAYSKESIGVGVFTAIDEEGGTVARAAQKLGTTAFDNMASYGARNDSTEAYYIGNTIGNDLRSLGFNLDFAPVADVNINPYNELGSRIFSNDPYVVANMSAYVAMGLEDAGVSATLKHFPGLGAEDGNTHTDSFVTIDRTLDELWAEEFVAFQQGINSGVDFVMVGHQIVTGIGDGLPSDLSYYTVTTLLKNQLGFNGIVITDSHEMNTIANVYGSGTAAVMAIQAGVDMVLMPSDLYSAVEAVCNAVNNGEISEARIDDSVLKILNKKYELGLFN